jgi:hypothetical protein
MEMSLLTQEHADVVLVAPIEKGLAMKLMSYDDFKIKQLQKSWKYGCRHCLQTALPPPPTEENLAPEPSDAPESSEVTDVNMVESEEQPKDESAPVKKDKIQKKQPKNFEFNGLRSHLKEK